MAVVPAFPLAGRAPRRVGVVGRACREAGLARAVHRAPDLVRVRVRVRVRVAYRALVVNNPFRTFNSFTGVAVFDLNAAGELEVYHSASTYFLFQFDPWISHEGLLPSTLWVGPVDATDVVPTVDGRADRHARPDSSIVLKSAWDALQAIPLDYERLWATDLCPASKQRFLEKTFVERAAFAITEGWFAWGGGEKMWGGFGKNFWNGTLSVLGFGSVVTQRGLRQLDHSERLDRPARIRRTRDARVGSLLWGAARRLYDDRDGVKVLERRHQARSPLLDVTS